ncbi:alginate lyase, partial [Streptomyces chartreusis]
FAATDVVHAAADAGDKQAQRAVPLLEEPPGGDLWALRPAAEQLDSIAG